MSKSNSQILFDDQNIINVSIIMNIEIMFKCHMSLYNWPPEMNMCQNLIQILLDGQDVINLLINDEYWNKVQMSHVTMGNPCRTIRIYKI
jgi:hypothetical protein